MTTTWRHDWQGSPEAAGASCLSTPARRAQAPGFGAAGPPPVTVAASCLPSDRAGGASGDWHDVIPLPSGDVAVAVGDAAGRGVQASPLKDTLQGGLRRMALTGAPPLELLAHLREVMGSDREAFATFVYAVVEPDRGDVLVTNAGHPPPLLVGRDRQARFLTESLDPPLGAPRPGSAPALGRAHMQAGDTLVLYTDGVVESRSRDIGEGLGSLAAAAMRWADSSLDDLCARLLSLGLGDENEHPDDLTVIALRLRG